MKKVLMKVLMVEDSPKISGPLEKLLEEIFLEIKLPKPSIKLATGEQEAIKMIGSEKQDLITLDGNLAENGHGINVLKKIDGENWRKTIIISSDEFFLKFCKVNHILALDKKNLSEETLLPLIKKILGLE